MRADENDETVSYALLFALLFTEHCMELIHIKEVSKIG